MMVGDVTASIVDARRMKRGGRRGRRRRRSRDLLTGAAGELGRGMVMVVVMMMMMMVRVMVLVLVLMLMLVVLIMLLLLLVMTRARGYALQSWRDDRMDRRLLAKLQPLLLPPVGDAGTTCRGIHRFASCPVASSSLPVSKQLSLEDAPVPVTSADDGPVSCVQACHTPLILSQKNFSLSPSISFLFFLSLSLPRLFFSHSLFFASLERQGT